MFSVALATLAAGGCAIGLICRLPVVGSERQSNANELSGKRWTFPGEPGFWVSYPVEQVNKGHAGGGADIAWMARIGFQPTQCRMGCEFNACWGSPLSTIDGRSWMTDRTHYQMSGRLYFHYRPVPKGTPGSVTALGHAFIKDGATCAGDFTKTP